ncbi:MAG: NADH-quinone oxidoreductase subunit C [Dehalococcoidia bacterium]
MTRFLTGHELAEHAERVAPGSVAKATSAACHLVPERAVEALFALRTDTDTDFIHLTNLCGVDWWDHFEVVYHVQSFDKNHFGTFKVDVWDREKPVAPSVISVWHGAWMQECEAYDLLGIDFQGNHRQHRILLWEGFPGFPLRKDWLSMPGGLQPGLSEFAGTARRENPPVRIVDE